MKAGVDILIAYKMDFKEFKDKEGYFIIIKESIHQEDNIHKQIKNKTTKNTSKNKMINMNDEKE